MQNASYQTPRSPVRHRKPATLNGDLARFILQLTVYAVFFLFIVIDGLRNPTSYDSKLLTLPYLIGGLALYSALWLPNRWNKSMMNTAAIISR